MQNNLNLIPGEAFTAGASVANNVIDKIEKIFHFVAIPKGKKKDFEEAVDCYVQMIKDNEKLSPLAKAAAITNARKTIKEYINQNDIVNIGINNIKDDEICLNEEWLMYFFDKAKNICDERLKVIWGKLLAEEATAGGISKKLLHILSIISLEDAKIFGKLCSYYVHVENIKGLNGMLQLFDATKIGIEAMQRLEALGLINFELGGAARMSCKIDFDEGKQKVINLNYFDEKVQMEISNGILNLGCATLTEEGEQLCKIIEPEKVDTLLQDILIENNKKRKYV